MRALLASVDAAATIDASAHGALSAAGFAALRGELAAADLEGRGRLDEDAFCGALRRWLPFLPPGTVAVLTERLGLAGSADIDGADFATALESLAMGDG
jgi:hypothetical protein